MPYLEAFTLGQRIQTPGRTIYQGDITAFAAMSGDWHRLHSDEEFARASEYGGIVAHGPLVLAVAYGLMVRAGMFGDEAVAFLGLNWAVRAPVRPHDTIVVQATVVEVRPSATRSDRGIVRFEFEVSNQRGEVVATGEWTNMFLSRPDIRRFNVNS